MQYLCTERAHLMCPGMCFGIVLSVGRPYEEARIRETLEALAAAHPFLRASLGWEEKTNAYFYRIGDRSMTELLLSGRETESVDSGEVLSEYERLTGREWNLREEGMLKAAVWRMGGETCFLLVFHHLLADGRSALGLARELADCYAPGVSPAQAGERLIDPAEDLPADSRLPFVSRVLVRGANRQWEKEGRRLSYPEYRAIAGAFLKEDRVRHSVSRAGPEEVEELRRKCREHQVTVNDYLLAKMMTEEKTGKVIMACDLRGLLGWEEGGLGNCATAFSVEVRTGEEDPFRLAEAVRRQVRRKMDRPREMYLVLQCYAALNPALLDAAFAASRGAFPSRAARFIGSRFFGYDEPGGYSVTNLGQISSGSITEAFFIPPASPAVRKTQGVLTVNGVMRTVTSERTPPARETGARPQGAAKHSGQ